MTDFGLFFPTVIATDFNKELAEQMLPVAKKYLSDCNILTNALDYKTTYSSGNGIEHNPDVAPFLNYINKKAKEYLEKCGYDTLKISLNAKIFVSEMQYGDSHHSHVHPNCILSGIMYLQVPNGSAPIVFSDVRSAKRMISLPRQHDTYINQSEVVVCPEPGMLLIWESWLSHSVPKNLSNTGRITIVFNFS
jgi:uncharacterized protein (TIGR02466 family)